MIFLNFCHFGKLAFPFPVSAFSLTSMFEVITVNFSGKVRRAVLNGKSYLVAPMTLIVPGVLNGSKGRLYYPPEEVSKNPSIWNNVPLTLGHPTHPTSNEHQSAKDEGVLERVGLGFTKNGRWDGSRLRADAWFEEDRTKQLAPTIHNKLQAEEPFELSTGLFTENEDKAGDHNGKPYDFIARNYRSDHVAVLLNEVGACAIKDGCGVIVNTDGSIEQLDTTTLNTFSPQARAAAALAHKATKKAFEKPILVKHGTEDKPHEAPDKHTIIHRANRVQRDNAHDTVGAAKEHRAIAKRHEELSNKAVISTAEGAAAYKGHVDAARAHHLAADSHMARNEETQVDNAEMCPECDAPMKDGKCSKCNHTSNESHDKETAVTVTRDQMLSKLTANCSCDKDKASLNGLSDDTVKLLYNTQPPEPAKKPDVAITVNSGETKPNQPDKPMSERMTPEELQVWNYGRQSMENHKQALVARLTANIADPERKKAMVANLSSKGIPELNDLLTLIPAPVVNHTIPHPQGTDMPPLFLGAAGGDYGQPVVNRVESQEVSEAWPPTLNYEEHSGIKDGKVVRAG